MMIMLSVTGVWHDVGWEGYPEKVMLWGLAI